MGTILHISDLHIKKYGETKDRAMFSEMISKINKSI